MQRSLVSTNWVWRNIDNSAVKLVDATSHMPATGRNALLEFQARHIKNSVFFDIDMIADTKSSLPHMMPDAEQFAKSAGQLGITNDHHIIIYDNSDLHSGTRAWWMFRSFGHKMVSYMDGGLTKWLAEDKPVTDEVTHVQTQKYRANLNPFAVCDASDVQENLKTQTRQVIDARSSMRFHGKTAEPRPGLRSGHIPFSINVPHQKLFQADRCFHNRATLRKIFKDAGTNFDNGIITSCGSGVTACVLLMGLHLIGKDDVSIYDGSWAEWGALSEEKFPVVIGEK